jgi:hypothetical protein
LRGTDQPVIGTVPIRPIGMAMLVGGGLAVAFEPVVDVLGLCHFPELGSWALFSAFGVTVPAYTLPTFAWYVGGQALLCLIAFDRGITRTGIVKLWASFAAVNALLEIPGIQLGVFTYYGPQLFQLFGFPLWWSFCNALSPILAASLIYKERHLFVGRRALLVVLIGPMAHAIANTAIAWPVWLALNSGDGYALTYPAALASLGLAGFALYLIGHVVASDAATKRTQKHDSTPKGKSHDPSFHLA